jgi:hypothetical protein
MELDEKCKRLVADQANQGTPIDITQARLQIGEYFKDVNVPQRAQNDPEHIYGFIFGLVPMVNFMTFISNYNATAHFDNQITAIRIYRAKQLRDKVWVQDLVIVPVKRNGEDHPEKMAMEANNFYLAGSGPCPNVCSQLYLI